MLYVTRLAQNQNDLINSILQYGCVVERDCCVVFSVARFSYLILCPRQCKEKVATTYLEGLRTIKIFQYKNLHKLQEVAFNIAITEKKKKNQSLFLSYIP